LNMKITDKTGEVINSSSVVNDDAVLVTTVKGIIIRMPLVKIRIMGRVTQGVRMINLAEGDFVSDLAKVPNDKVVDEIEVSGQKELKF